MSRLNRIFEQDIELQESLADADNLYDDNEDTIIGVLEDRAALKENKVHLFENQQEDDDEDYELQEDVDNLLQEDEELQETADDLLVDDDDEIEGININEVDITDVYDDPDLDLDDCLLDDEDDL